MNNQLFKFLLQGSSTEDKMFLAQLNLVQCLFNAAQ